jgi:hypothetical protein
VSTLSSSLDFLYSDARNCQGVLVRAVCDHLSNKLEGYETNETAGHFNRDPVAICQGLKKVGRRLKKDRDLEGVMNALEINLTEKGKRKTKT